MEAGNVCMSRTDARRIFSRRVVMISSTAGSNLGCLVTDPLSECWSSSAIASGCKPVVDEGIAAQG
jgi:hypothetical protein